MPGKDKVDLRQCVELLTRMLENETSFSQSTAPNTRRPVRGRKAVVTTGRSSRHSGGPRPSTLPPHGRMTSGQARGQTGRGHCGCQQQAQPAEGRVDGDDGDEWEVDDAENFPRENTEERQTSTAARYAEERTDSECSCSSAHDVPFNQRLLSSTPTGTPTRRRLVERHGVLMLNGSTNTQVLNATDTAAAVRPPSPPRPCGPCLQRGDVQFAPAPQGSSSAASVQSSTGSSNVDAGQSNSAANPHLSQYSATLSCYPPHIGTSIPGYNTGWRPQCTGTRGGAPLPHYTNSCGIPLCRPVSTSAVPGMYPHPHHQSYDAPAARPTTDGRARSGAVHSTKVQTSTGVSLPQTTTHPVHYPPRSSGAGLPTCAACSCAQTAAVTNVTSTAVATDRSRPPVTLAASSSQETIEIQLEQSPGRSKPREPPTRARRTATEKSGLHRRRLGSGVTRGRHQSADSSVRKPRPRGAAENVDDAQLTSLLRQLRAVISANRSPEVARLLSEICDGARTSPLLPPPAQSAVEDQSLEIQRLQSEVAQLNRQLQVSRQQLREKDELVSAMRKPDESCQLDHLTMLTRHLEKQLEESRVEVQSLRSRVERLSDESDRVTRDKTALLQTLSQKDEQRACEVEEREKKLRERERELAGAREQTQDCEQRLAAAGRNIESLTLQLQQKDTEIQRSRDLVRGLHQSMSRLVHDLQSSRPPATAAAVTSSSSLMSVQLSDTLTTIHRQLNQLEPLATPDSFVTPPVHSDVDRPPNSAQRSLDFGRSRLNSDPVPLTSDPVRLSNHSCPDVSSCIERRPARQPRSSVDDAVLPSRPSVGSTTVKALLTPIARQLQTSSAAATPPRRGQRTSTHTDQLDRTLTAAGQECSRTVDDSISLSRWSASDYFHRYPGAAWVDSAAVTRDGTPYSESKLHRFTAPASTAGHQVDRDTGADFDSSTLISSIRPDGSPPVAGRTHSAPSVDSSVQTSSSLDSISTTDDAAFRAGLAQLDADIALVQRRLRGSLTSSPNTSPCRSPRSNLDRHT